MTRQEYEFLELAGKWGNIPAHKKNHIVDYTRHKRAAGFGLYIPAAVVLLFVLEMIARLSQYAR